MVNNIGNFDPPIYDIIHYTPEYLLHIKHIKELETKYAKDLKIVAKWNAMINRSTPSTFVNS